MVRLLCCVCSAIVPCKIQSTTPKPCPRLRQGRPLKHRTGYDVAPDGDIETWIRFARGKFGPSDKSGDCSITATDFDHILGHCEAVTDCPAACFAAELIAVYPTAKVIMNTRNIDDWHRSIVDAFGKESALRKDKKKFFGGWFCAQDYWLRRGFYYFYEAFYYGSLEAHGKWVYREHVAMVRGMVPEERLLEYEIGEGWEPLCKFLGKEVPEEEFPHGNMPGQLADKAAAIFAKYDRVRRRNIAVFLALSGACVGVLGYGLSQVWLRA